MRHITDLVAVGAWAVNAAVLFTLPWLTAIGVLTWSDEWMYVWMLHVFAGIALTGLIAVRNAE